MNKPYQFPDPFYFQIFFVFVTQFSMFFFQIGSSLEGVIQSNEGSWTLVSNKGVSNQSKHFDYYYWLVSKPCISLVFLLYVGNRQRINRSGSTRGTPHVYLPDICKLTKIKSRLHEVLEIAQIALDGTKRFRSPPQHITEFCRENSKLKRNQYRAGSHQAKGPVKRLLFSRESPKR